MECAVYILYSIQMDQFYVGSSCNLEDRLNRHKNHGSKSTKKATDWELVYFEKFSDRTLAVRRELEIKKKKSRKYIEFLIHGEIARVNLS
jgi:putative endonuclease